LVLLPPERSRKSSVLIGVNLIVNGDRLNLYTSGGVSLKKFDEILRMRSKPVFTHGAAQHRSTCFHPSGRTPDAREQIKIWVEFVGFTQGWKNPGLIVLDAELL